MSKRTLVIALVLVLVFLTGCGSPNPVSGEADFLNGLWDGITMWFAFIGNILDVGPPEWNIYEVKNNGWPYNLGFLLGAGSWGGGCYASNRN